MSFIEKVTSFIVDIKKDYYGADVTSIEVNKRLYDIVKSEFNSARTYSGHEIPTHVPQDFVCVVGENVIKIKKAKEKVKYAKYLVKHPPHAVHWTEQTYRVGKQPKGAIYMPGSEYEEEE